jgi:hypothetical protein
MQALFSILLSLILGWGCSHLAKHRNRSPGRWFVAGLFFGILALIILFILPIRRRNEVFDSEKSPSQKVPKLTALSQSHQEKLWYFLDEKKTQIGPMSFDALSKAWKEGKVQEHTYVWNEAMDNWQQFQEVIGPLQS